MRKLSILFANLLPGGMVFGQDATADRFVRVVSRMVEAMNAADYVGIQRDFSKGMLDFFPLEKSTPFFKNLRAEYGKIKSLDPARIIFPNHAIIPAHFERTILDIKIILDKEDKMLGLGFLPHTSIPIPDKNETELSLPFKGEWLVLWGGDTRELNIHHGVPSSGFAFDFLGVDERGEIHKGDGEANDDYYAFGREVLAPANGTVTDVIRGVRDNVLPGSMNPYSALGNAVFIRHREYEVSVLAHLKLGSIKVKVADKVKRGQLIGLCGNSGNSSNPHLHYHLQNTPITQDATGIKCYFQKVIVTKDGKKEVKTKYSPVKGEIVSPE